MSWFTYLVKTPWAQKKQDWNEYKKIEQERVLAIKKLKNAWEKLTVEFNEGDDFGEENGCIKKQFIYARVRINGQVTDFKLSDEPYESRCKNFTPIGDEQLCPCIQCSEFAKNKQYFDARNNLKKITNEYKNFWTQKVKQK